MGKALNRKLEVLSIDPLNRREAGYMNTDAGRCSVRSWTSKEFLSWLFVNFLKEEAGSTAGQ